MIKLLCIFIFFLSGSLPAIAQTDRTKPPRPGPAPEIKIGEYKSFVLTNGLKVFIVENHRIPVVTYNLTFVNTPVLEKEFAGYSQFTGELLGTGTKTRTKAQINEELDFIGASFDASASGFTASSLKKHTSRLLEIVSDILIQPVFTREELEKIRTQTLSAIAANKNDPSSVANDVMNVLNFGPAHPYGEIITEASAKKITLEQCLDYYNTFFRPNVAFLSIVGDISPEEAKALIQKYFSNWEKKNVPDYQYKKPVPPEKRTVALVDRKESVQSLINLGYAIDLTLSNPDYIKARVANTVLGGSTYRLYKNLREKHGYTYGAYSSLRSMPLSGHFLITANVRNEVTDSAIFQILLEMGKMRNEPVPSEELARVKNYMTGNFALSLENPQTIAGFAINIERYKLPGDFYKNYLKKVAQVTSSDIQKISGKYILPENCNILIVGKTSEIADKVKIFSSYLKYYTDEGIPYDPLTGIPVLPDTLMARHILNRYIEAIGGESRISEVKDMNREGTISAQGMNLSVNMVEKFPDKAITEIKLGNNIINKAILFGDKVISTSMQNDQEADEMLADLLKLQAMIFPENKLEDFGYSATLKGIEKNDSRLNYVVEIRTPSGGTITDYFDMETGLRSKTVTMIEGPNGKVRRETKYLEYFEMDGIKYVKKMLQVVGSQSFDIHIQSVSVNTNPPDEIFR